MLSPLHGSPSHLRAHPSQPPTIPTPQLSTRTRATRLELLRRNDHNRPWFHLDERRICVLCGEEFAGTEIRIAARRGTAVFRCPSANCQGSLPHFVRIGNPFLDEHLWMEWMESVQAATSAIQLGLLQDSLGKEATERLEPPPKKTMEPLSQNKIGD
jgi:hypothetical protein